LLYGTKLCLAREVTRLLLEEQRRAIGEAELKGIKARSAKVDGGDSTNPWERQRRDLVYNANMLCAREEEEDSPKEDLEEARRAPTEVEMAGVRVGTGFEGGR
jgi:hypothetical protein